MVDAIMYISGSPIPLSKNDLEGPKMIELAYTNGINAITEYEWKINYQKEKAFQNENENDWKRFKEIFTKTTVEGFIALR